MNYSRHISVWLVVTLTLERMFAVYCPSKVKDVCVPKTGFIVVAIVIAILFASDAHILFGITSITYGNKTGCGFTNTRFEKYYLFYFPWIDLTIGLILPAIVIIASNSAILVRVFKSTAALTTTTGTNRRDKNKQLVRMTLLVSTVFLILYLPRQLYIVSRPYIYELSDTAFAFANETNANLSTVTANLALLNHGINFMLYTFSGKRFRNELRNTLCRSPATVAPELRIRSLQTNARVTQRNSDATNERPTKQANYQFEERKSNETEIENRKIERMFDEQNEETAVFSGKWFRNELRNTLCRSPATAGHEPGIRSIQTSARATRQNSEVTNAKPTEPRDYQLEGRNSIETEVEKRTNERLLDGQNEETAL